MQGDFTRLTFDPLKHYSRVLMQQGRVQLDADWNELVEMQLHFLRRLAADLIGPHGGPGNSFQITTKVENGKLADLNLNSGHYYVDGILCENEERLGADGKPLATSYYNQPYLRLERAKNKLPDLPLLAYLHVWERHLTYLEDEDEQRIGIREVALRGPDTTTRTQIVWQIEPLALKLDELNRANTPEKRAVLVDEKLKPLRERSRALLAARTDPQRRENDPCLISADSRYRGAENQLYRVEIQGEGPAGKATFKWSRENGSVIFPIEDLQGELVTLKHLGRDSRFGLRPDDWVELVDDEYVWRQSAEALLQIKTLDSENLQVTLKQSPAAGAGQAGAKHRFLRRWDHPQAASAGGLLVAEGNKQNEGDWITLEDGVQILFPAPATGAPANFYRSGDYWLIPARVATGELDWPGAPRAPLPQPPHGIKHHYAPLAIVAADLKVDDTLRRTWDFLGKEPKQTP